MDVPFSSTCPRKFVSDVIELRELRVQAVVGVLSEERDRAQPLALDIDIERPFEEASINDDLAETTNYADVLQIATKVATEGAFLLLETLAYRVAREILAYDEWISSVTIAVRKLHPPVAEDVATVGVRCTVSRP
jgi:7,8-dihydroneopterin aldolase/epimerase/oxygenase